MVLDLGLVILTKVVLPGPVMAVAVVVVNFRVKQVHFTAMSFYL